MFLSLERFFFLTSFLYSVYDFRGISGYTFEKYNSFIFTGIFSRMLHGLVWVLGGFFACLFAFLSLFLIQCTLSLLMIDLCCSDGNRKQNSWHLE